MPVAAAIAEKPLKRASDRLVKSKFRRIRHSCCKEIPLSIRVDLVIIDPPDNVHLGWVIKTGRITYEMTIVRGHEQYHLTTTLLHEFAHIMQDIEYGENVNDHGEEFGICWAAVYCSFFHTT